MVGCPQPDSTTRNWTIWSSTPQAWTLDQNKLPRFGANSWDTHEHRALSLPGESCVAIYGTGFFWCWKIWKYPRINIRDPHIYPGDLRTHEPYLNQFYKRPDHQEPLAECIPPQYLNYRLRLHSKKFHLQWIKEEKSYTRFVPRLCSEHEHPER